MCRYNEFIVYDASRIRLKYMVLLRERSWVQQRRRKWLLANKIIQRPGDPDPEKNVSFEGEDAWKYYPKLPGNSTGGNTAAK